MLIYMCNGTFCQQQLKQNNNLNLFPLIQHTDLSEPFKTCFAEDVLSGKASGVILILYSPCHLLEVASILCFYLQTKYVIYNQTTY